VVWLLAVPVAHDLLGILAVDEELDRLFEPRVGDAVELHCVSLEVVALDHDAGRRRLPLDLLEPWHRPARYLGDPERERSR